MPSELQPRYELDSFEARVIGVRKSRSIAKFPRRFEAMADVESIMLLQLGVELGLFPGAEAENLLKKHGERFFASLKYVETHSLSQVFGSELQILSSGMRTRGLSYVPHPKKLSPDLFDSAVLEMLIHQIGRDFRDNDFTITVSFEPSEGWERHLKGKLRPDVILCNKVTRDINLVIEQYLAFLEHAGGLSDLWGCLEEGPTPPYARDELRRRFRAMHGWRLDLHQREVRKRFERITAIFVRALNSDEELEKIGFDTAHAVARIERLCQDWSGDEGLTLDLPSDSKRGGRLAA